jgi:hypothetical protein
VEEIIILWRIYPFLGSDRKTKRNSIRCKTAYFMKQEQTIADRERFGKHVSAATDTHSTIQVLLEMGFSTVVRAEGL